MNSSTSIGLTQNSYAFLKTIFCSLLLFWSCFSFADTHTLTETGSWSVAANWTPAVVPIASDSIIVPSNKTLILDSDVAIHTVSLAEGGRIEGFHNLTITNKFLWKGNIEECNIVVSGILDLTENAVRSIVGSTITVNGVINWSQGNLGLGQGSTLTVSSGTVFNMLHTVPLSSGLSSDAILNIQGIVSKTQNSATTLACKIQLSGTINITAGSIYATGNGTYTGDVAISSGAFFDLGGGTHDFDLNADVSGTGDFKVSGGVATFNPGSTNICNLDISGGGLFDNAGLSVTNITQSGSSEFGGGAPTPISGSYNWQGGTISGSKNIAGTLTVSTTGTKTVSGSLVLAGSGTWTDGNINIPDGGLFKVASGASFSIDHTSSRNFGSASAGLIEIAGVVTKTINSTTRIRSEIRVVSGGFLNIAAGTMQCSTGSSGNHSGTINISSGAFFEVNRGTQNFNSSATVIGAGTIQLTSQGIAIFNSGSSMSAKLEISGSTSRYTDEVGTTPSQITMSSGTFDGAGTATCTGSLDWSGGTIGGTNSLIVNGLSTFSGTTRNLTRKTLDLVGNGNWTSGDFVFSNPCTLKINTASTLQLAHAVSQQISGAGLVYIMGTMRKTVANNTTTISVNVMNTGRVEGVGNVVFSMIDNENIHSPGISGIGTLGVNTFENNKGSLEIQIQGNGGSGIGHDVLQVGGAATLGGNLNVSLLSGFVPNVGDSYTILTASNITASFTENLPSLPSGRNWSTTYSALSVIIEVVALLPVELSRFEANTIKDHVELFWSTDSETSNKGFEVQRSYDGSYWRTITFVNGGGTTTSSRNYQYLDNPDPGTIYYRLRQVDWDGHADLSKVVSAKVNVDGSYRFAEVYPNPVENKEINVNFPNGLEVIAFYTISDANGHIALKGAFEPRDGYIHTIIDAKRLSSRGIYYLTISSGNVHETVKLMFE